MTMVRGFEDLKQEREEEKRANVPKLEWASNVLDRVKHTKAGAPSPMYIWYFKEDEKRRRGLENEIDLADIRAAMIGVRNKWSDAVNKHPDVFKGLGLKDGKFDWSAAFACRQGCV